MNKLPVDSLSQKIGRQANKALQAQSPDAWILKEQDGDSDFGIDYLVQLKNIDDGVEHSFFLQLKGTTAPEYSVDKKFITHSLKVSTLGMYQQQDPLVMVAVVDIQENKKNWECPIYYFWLDEQWFYENNRKFEKQKTISLKIPTSQIITEDLDVFPFYSNRIKEKLAFSTLKREIGPHTDDLLGSIDMISKKLSEKPLLLKTIENSGDEPWIENPAGEVPTLLKQCSESISVNQVKKAKSIIANLEMKLDSLTPKELAEFYLQEATILSLEGEFLQASMKLKQATEYSDKDRYKLAYIESRLKLDIPKNQDELTKIISTLSENDYRNAILKAKCMTLLGKVDEALIMLREKFPQHASGRLLISTISGDFDILDKEINNINDGDLKTERDKFIYHFCLSRREYFRANKDVIVYDEIQPILGRANVNLETMKKSHSHIICAWDYARSLGYPSDILILLDISPLIFGYFNRMVDLYAHFENILSEIPKQPSIIKLYSRLLSNENHHEKALDLLKRIPEDLNTSDMGVIIFANYHLRRFREALSLLKKHEEEIVQNAPENLSLLLCIGAELAREDQDEILYDKYLNIVKELKDGEAMIAVNTFILKARQAPANSEELKKELYESYIKLDKPLIIAQNLLSFLEPRDVKNSERIIELAEEILKTYHISEDEYFSLSNAYIILKRFDKSLEIATSQITKEVYNPQWHIIKAISLQGIGKIGLAYEDIKSSLEHNRFSNDHLKQYVHLCLRFGLLDEVEEALTDLLNVTIDRSEKVLYLTNLINIYSVHETSIEKQSRAIKKLGSLVNQNDMDEEGKYLVNVLSSSRKDFSKEEISDFQVRLKKYSENFPKSPVLISAKVDLEGGPEKIVNSINTVLGISDKQITQWEKNKNNIKNGKLPVPFRMLDKFLNNTRDIFTSWRILKTMAEEKSEFMIHHSNQNMQEDFNLLLSGNKKILIEDSSLLILSEIGLLDTLLDHIEEFVLLESTFSQVVRDTLPSMVVELGSTSHDVLESINKNKDKLRIISDNNSDCFETTFNELNERKTILITDDACFLNLINTQGCNSNHGNIFNLIEYFHSNSPISLGNRFDYIVKVCTLGLRQPNMTIELLGEALVFFLGPSNIDDYSDTKFQIIFDKIFSSLNPTTKIIPVFYKMIFSASKNKKFNISAKKLSSLFRGILIRHKYTDYESLTSHWFMWQCIITDRDEVSPLITSSSKHRELMNIYKEIMYILNNKILTLDTLMINVINNMMRLDKYSCENAFETIKLCFTPMTKDYEIFVNHYNEMLINKQLSNLHENGFK